jgi:small subunit ribosomal protein S9
MKKTTKKVIKKVSPKRKTKEKKDRKEKKPISKKLAKKKEEKKEISKPNYIEAIGRRKTATCRVRIFPKSKEKTFLINKKEINYYFPESERQKIVLSPLQKTNLLDKFKIEVRAKGGGKKGQSEAIRLGLARVLLKVDSHLRQILKSQDYLTCNSRVKERKKFGLKKARKAPQWSKR